jgi:peptidoglycan/LPS O-acetylase OafA/YrhL
MTEAYAHIRDIYNKKLPYYPELTGLRGLAISIVVVGHLSERFLRFDQTLVNPHLISIIELISNPIIGCYLFFALSGYSIYSRLLSRDNTIQASAVVLYVLRRVAKIIPIYYGLLISTYIFIELFSYTPDGTRQFLRGPASLTVSLFSSIFLSHDIIYCDFPRLFPPGWFIETQIQFYVFAPFILLILSKLRKLDSYGLILFVSTPAIIVASKVLADQSCRMSYSLVEFLPYFWCGFVAAELSQNSARGVLLSLIKKICFPALFTFSGILIPFYFQSTTGWLVTFWIVSCIAALILISFLSETIFRSILRSKTMLFLGVSSYSIYLIHLQVEQILVQVLVKYQDRSFEYLPLVLGYVMITGAVLILSSLLYYCVERPSARGLQWALSKSARQDGVPWLLRRSL